MKKCCVILLAVILLCMVILGCYKIGESTRVQGAGSNEEVYINDKDEKKKIALTFDDGPNEEWTPILLDGLKQRGAKVSFFVIGEKAEANPEIIRRMKQEGHLIGNHTFSHVQLTSIGAEAACQEIKKTNQVLYEITGEYPQYIRPPFGSWNKTLECSITMFPVLWNIDTLDWSTQNEDRSVAKAVSQAKENGIILLHDNYETSINAALRIVDELQKEGYEFVTVDEILLE